MSTDEKGTPTPQKTLNLATQQASLPKLALIGTFGSLTDPGALIRDGRGRIHRVTLNDKISDGIVAAIGDDSVVLAQRGRTVTLKLKYNDFQLMTRARSLPRNVEGKEQFAAIGHAILDDLLPLPRPIRLMGLTLSNLERDDVSDEGTQRRDTGGGQLALF